jgi:hypothetical protein
MPMEELTPDQMLNVGLKLVPEVALGESQEVQPGEFPRSRMSKVLSPRTVGIDNHSAADGGHDVGERYIIAAGRFQNERAGERVS